MQVCVQLTVVQADAILRDALQFRTGVQAHRRKSVQAHFFGIFVTLVEDDIDVNLIANRFVCVFVKDSFKSTPRMVRGTAR